MLYIFGENILHQSTSKLKKCGNLCSFIFVTLSFLTIIILLAVFAVDITEKVHVIYIKADQVHFKTDKRFLSIALDTSLIATGFKNFALRSERIKKMVNALTPCYLRVGGTMADTLTFSTSHVGFKPSSCSLDGGECSYDQKNCDFLPHPNFTMSAYEWLELNHFANSTGAVVIFDLNSLKRFENGTWNYTNAEKLIEFSDSHQLNVNWELGNEPNAFRHQFNYYVAPTQMAKDFQTLRKILKKYPKYAHSLLVGPDVTRPQSQNNDSEIYLRDFLPGAADVIDAVTWHQYYFNGATAKIGDFLNPQNLDLLQWQINVIKNISKSQGVKKPIWLGETSSAYGGGAPHLSDRYIATFLWLDKLGMAAKNGLSVVIRQSLFQGNYALINNHYNPTPDWWVSIVYKKLVGTKVVDCKYTTSEKLRLYCHCTNQKIYYGNAFITVFGLNLDNKTAKIRFEGINLDDDNKHLRVDAYILTAINRIDSRFVYLNNQQLRLTSTHDVPKLLPKNILAYPYVQMPPYSLAFWVIPINNNALPSC